MKNSEVEQQSNASQYAFPKYTTQIINLLNSNAQGTRPAVVGQMSNSSKSLMVNLWKSGLSGTISVSQMR